jgi:hypothetical protein
VIQISGGFESKSAAQVENGMALYVVVYDFYLFIFQFGYEKNAYEISN